jgi:cellobiose-specific phosphotransferase system component IIC
MGTVERLEVEPIVAHKIKPISTPEAKPNILLETFNSLLPIFAALASILAIRLFLLFAIIGSFILAQAALADMTDHGIWVLISYCAFTVLPLVYLDIHGKKGS